MELRNNLYKIIASRPAADGAKASFDLELDKHHFIYQAHFPGEPITPGVCIIQTGMELLEQQLGCRLEVKRVKNVKFLSIISPETTPRITYVIDKLTPAEETSADACLRHAQAPLQVQMHVLAGDEMLTKLSMVVAKRGAPSL